MVKYYNVKQGVVTVLTTPMKGTQVDQGVTLNTPTINVGKKLLDTICSIFSTPPSFPLLHGQFTDSRKEQPQNTSAVFDLFRASTTR